MSLKDTSHFSNCRTWAAHHQQMGQQLFTALMSAPALQYQPNSVIYCMRAKNLAALETKIGNCYGSHGTCTIYYLHTWAVSHAGYNKTWFMRLQWAEYHANSLLQEVCLCNGWKWASCITRECWINTKSQSEDKIYHQRWENFDLLVVL